MSTTKCDVVVIGAGISGLTAAYRLKKKNSNLHVVVLEAKDRVGGRTHSVEMKAASGVDTWDMGAQWVGRCQPHIISLLDELQLKRYPQHVQGVKVMQLGDNSVRTYKSDIPSLSIFALIDLHLFISKIEKMRTEVDPSYPWSCSSPKEWDAISMDSFLEDNLWTTGARDAIEAATRCMLGVELAQVSVLFYLMYLSAADGIKNLIEATPFSAQEYRITGGAQLISERLVEFVGEGNINLEQPVVSIEQGGASVMVTTATGDIYMCDRVICAIPPPAVGYISFSPPLLPYKQELTKRMPIGSIIKVIITYKKAFWRDHGFSGEAVTNGGYTRRQDCDRGPLCIVYDATSAKGNPALVAFLGGSQAIQWAAVTARDRQQAVLKQLVSFFGQDSLKFLDYLEMDWNTVPYTQGGPVCSIGPGGMMCYTKGAQEHLQRVHFAGTEIATQWCGFMSGAVQSGQRAALEVLSRLQPELITDEDEEIVKLIQGESPVIAEGYDYSGITLTELKVCLGIFVFWMVLRNRTTILSYVSKGSFFFST